jgi:hypothetical protein
MEFLIAPRGSGTPQALCSSYLRHAPETSRCPVGARKHDPKLWHWPVLMIAVEYAGHELGVGVKLGLLLGAFLLSVTKALDVVAMLEHSNRSVSPTPQFFWRAPS